MWLQLAYAFAVIAPLGGDSPAVTGIQCQSHWQAILSAREAVLRTADWVLWHESRECTTWRRFTSDNDATHCKSLDCPHKPWEVYQAMRSCFELADSCSYHRTYAFMRFRQTERRASELGCPASARLSPREEDFLAPQQALFIAMAPSCSEQVQRADEAARQWSSSEVYNRWRQEPDCRHADELEDLWTRVGCHYSDGGWCSSTLNAIYWADEMCTDSQIGCQANASHWYWDMYEVLYAPPCE